MNNTMAVAFGVLYVIDPHPNITTTYGSVLLKDIRAELQAHNLFLKWDNGYRSGEGQYVSPGWWLYKGVRRDKNPRRLRQPTPKIIARGPLPTVLRAALQHVGIGPNPE